MQVFTKHQVICLGTRSVNKANISEGNIARFSIQFGLILTVVHLLQYCENLSFLKKN